MLSWIVFSHSLSCVFLVCYLVAKVLFTILDHSIPEGVRSTILGSDMISTLSLKGGLTSPSLKSYIKTYGVSFVITMSAGLVGMQNMIYGSSLVIIALLAATFLPSKYRPVIRSSWSAGVVMMMVLNLTICVLFLVTFTIS